MKISIKKLNRIQRDLEKEIKILEAKLTPFIDFDFFIDYQQSDGCFMIVDEIHSNTGVLKKCIEHIEKHGRLTFNDYKNNYCL